ncbi:MAG: hypothetical protein MRY77_01750 [Rhodobacteraceae bacterium]|nr:hypothetical protein [Paracoccaceae bacterium]
MYSSTFELSEVQFAIAFAINGFGFFITFLMVAKVGVKLGMVRMINIALSVFMVSLIALVVLAYLELASLYLTVFILFIGFSSLGLVVPSTVVMSLEHHGEIAGFASSLGGVIRFLTAGIVIALASPFLSSALLPMLVAILICGTLAFVLTRVLLRGEAKLPA